MSHTLECASESYVDHLHLRNIVCSVKDKNDCDTFRNHFARKIENYAALPLRPIFDITYDLPSILIKTLFHKRKCEMKQFIKEHNLFTGDSDDSESQIQWQHQQRQHGDSASESDSQNSDEEYVAPSSSKQRNKKTKGQHSNESKDKKKSRRRKNGRRFRDSGLYKRIKSCNICV